MTTELKPCPFCNADMSSFVQSAEGFCRGEGSTLYVPCDCGAMGPEGKTIDDAIAAWNRRTPVEQLSAHPAKTEQPSLSDAEILKHFSKYWEHQWKDSQGNYARILQDDLVKGVHALLSAQRQDSNKDAAIGEQCVSSSGDPIGCYRVRCHLGKVCAAIANGAPK